MDNKTVKANLEQYKIENVKVEILKAQLEELDEISKSISSIKTDNIKINNSITADRTGKFAVRIISLMEEIEASEKKAEETRKQVERIINKIPDDSIHHVRQKAVLKLRYIDLLPWTNCTRGIFGQKTDYKEREESYYRRTTLLHGKALETLSEILETGE